MWLDLKTLFPKTLSIFFTQISGGSRIAQGLQTLEGVLKATIWHTFCRELDENERILTVRGARFPCTPLGSATANL